MSESQPENKLKSDAIGLVGVLFMTVATAAPLSSMVANLSISAGFGSGAGTPASYMVATGILVLFSLGFSAMAKKVSSTGAFYGYIVKGLGKPLGFASGILIALAYMIFETAIIAACAYFITNSLDDYWHMHVPWILCALVILLINGVLSYFRIDVASKVLGLLLAGEIGILAVICVSVLVRGGGPEGWSWSSLNPLNGLSSLHLISHSGAILTGSASISLLFCFWSWTGFESSAMYAEESRHPQRNIPIAIITSVIGIGVFYVLVSWLALVGIGPQHSVEISQDPNNAGEILYENLRHIGNWIIPFFKILLLTSTFACGLSFHNCASRYIYSLCRENVIPGLQKISQTHPQYHSPYIASGVQSVFAACVTLIFFLAHKDPYSAQYTLLSLIGTAMILIIQTLVAISVISYFHLHPQKTEGGHWFRTALAPLLSGIGMIYIIYLLLSHSALEAGTEVHSAVFQVIPWIMVLIFIGSCIIAIYLKYRATENYARIGSMSNMVDLPQAIVHFPIQE